MIDTGKSPLRNHATGSIRAAGRRTKAAAAATANAAQYNEIFSIFGKYSEPRANAPVA